MDKYFPTWNTFDSNGYKYDHMLSEIYTDFLDSNNISNSNLIGVVSYIGGIAWTRKTEINHMAT